MKMIKNPILRGFNPDPSIIRVGDDYFIATSTFEWWPGVQIHHSKDLVNWRLIGHALTKKSQLNMTGVPDSCGVWAPCLSYHEGTFYLVFSNVKSFDGTWKDTPNYLVTTDDIFGEWSEPIFLNASGFDGSLFHDDDGKKWYLSMLVDHRKGKFFGGIIMQEYSTEQEKLIGEVHYLYEGTEFGLTEGPHVYKKDGYYYMALAEGGTEYGHAFSIVRSKSLFGEWENHPDKALITSRNNPSLELQKAGHGDLVQTQSGDWYATCLVGRPLTEHGRCITGRETAIQKVTWEEGEWPRLAHGSNEPNLEVEAPDLPEHTFESEPNREDFDKNSFTIHLQSLRQPVSDRWLSLERTGYVRLYGQESLSSFHHQSMLARRVQSHHIVVSTCLEFAPESFQQMAGLVCYYNTYHFHYLYVSGGDQTGEKYLNIVTCDKHRYHESLEVPLDIMDADKIYLKADFDGADLQFYYGLKNNDWKKLGPVLDGSILSDDYVQDAEVRYRPAFTGSFVGMACQDLTGRRLHADFDWFDYEEIG